MARNGNDIGNEYYIAHFLYTYSNALYKQVIYGWGQTSAYKGAAGSRYQSISDLTQHINEWNEAWPQHWERRETDCHNQ